MTVISAKNLSLTFTTNDGPVHALSEVNLDIAKGEFVSFIGPSGEPESVGPSSDSGEEVALCVASKVIWMYLGNGSLINVTLSNVPGRDQVAAGIQDRFKKSAGQQDASIGPEIVEPHVKTPAAKARART